MPACGPVRLIAGTPSAWRAIDSERRALVLAGREQDVELARVGFVGDRGGEAEQLVGRVAHRRDDDDEVVAGGALARDPPGDALDAVGVGDGRAAELLDDEGGRHRRGILPRGRARSGRTAGRGLRCTRPSPPGGSARCASTSTAARRSRRSPAARSTATPLDADRGRRQPLRRRSGRGRRADRRRRRDPARRPRPPPVLRGARPAVRGARHRRARHRLLRADGGLGAARRRTSSTCRTSPRRRGPGSRPTSRPAVDGAAGRPTATGPRRGRCSRSASAWAAGCRSWRRRSGSDLAGVIGFYGTLVGPWRNDAPAPVDVAAAIAAPVLGLFGGADEGITRRGDRGVRRGARRRPASTTGSSPTRARRTASSTARRPSSPTRARRPGTRSWRSSGTPAVAPAPLACDRRRPMDDMAAGSRDGRRRRSTRPRRRLSGRPSSATVWARTASGGAQPRSTTGTGVARLDDLDRPGRSTSAAAAKNAASIRVMPGHRVGEREDRRAGARQARPERAGLARRLDQRAAAAGRPPRGTARGGGRRSAAPAGRTGRWPARRRRARRRPRFATASAQRHRRPAGPSRIVARSPGAAPG